MQIFKDDSHLSDEALAALANNSPLSELQRLEIAEHMAYCDECLLRYTLKLSEDTLVNPPLSCQATVRKRIRERNTRIFVNRWATAAAAVAIVVTLWSTGTFNDMVTVSQHMAEKSDITFSESIHNWPDKLDESINRQFDKINNVFNNLWRQ